MQSPESADKLQRILETTQRELDELASEHLRQNTLISQLQHQLLQKSHGIELLSELQASIAGLKEISAIYKLAIESINSKIVMDRSVVLLPGEQDNTYRPSQWAGFPEEDEARLRGLTFTFPPEFRSESGLLMASKATAEPSIVQELKTAFGLSGFICVPVVVEGAPIAVILSGRIRELRPLYPPLDQGDAYIFRCVVGWIVSSIKNIRVSVLQELDRLKTEFFANISHEFRTPITLTLGPIDAMLGGRHGSIPDAVQRQLSVMKRSQQRLLDLINQILDLEKLEAGKMSLKASRIPGINRFIERIAEQFKALAEKKGLELRMKLKPEADTCALYADVEKFDKVVFNLLSNAHKFTKKGHVEISTDVEAGHFVLRVSDSGIGIREDQLPHIFDRFRQADGSESRDYSGTGIGLSLVKEVAKLHGGEVTVYSEYGKGTSFKVKFPTGTAHLDPASIVETPIEEHLPQSQLVDIAEGAQDLEGVAGFNAEAEAKALPSRPTVLVVDDNRDIRNHVRSLLADQYNVFFGSNGKEGFELARKYRPDLILSDVMMPIMSGVELCKAVREDPELKLTPLVLLTAKASHDSKIAGLEEGADDYLSKPFSPAELLARVKNLLLLRQHQLRLKKELQAAREIQQALLPPATQRCSGVAIEALYRPCEELSGDFYDSIVCGEWVYLYLADVMSHGTAAAQITYVLKGIFQQAVRNEPPSLETLLGEVGRTYARYNFSHHISIQLVRIHSRSGELEYCRSGAPAAIQISESNEAKLLSPETAPLLSSYTPEFMGQVPLSVPLSKARFEAGDRLFLFTDGCYEIGGEDGQRLGVNGFYKILKKHNRQGWTQEVASALDTKRGKQAFEDDFTIVRVTC